MQTCRRQHQDKFGGQAIMTLEVCGQLAAFHQAEHGQIHPISDCCWERQMDLGLVAVLPCFIVENGGREGVKQKTKVLPLQQARCRHMTVRRNVCFALHVQGWFIWNTTTVAVMRSIQAAVG